MKKIVLRALTCLCVLCILFGGICRATTYKIKLSSSNLRLAPGESKTVTWSVEPVSLMNHTATWTSENPYVASVNESGKITAHAAGTTCIHIAIENGTERKITVTVTGQPVTKLLLAENEITLETGESRLLTYTMNESADDKRVKWSSDDTAVAKVDQSGNVTAVGGGVARITLLAVNGMTAACTVYVPSEVKSIKLDPDTAYLGIGAQISPEAYVFPGNARDREVSWESSNESVASVDENGIVTALSTGECAIRAMTQNGTYALMRVYVSVLPEVLSLSPSPLVLSKEKRHGTISVNAVPAESAGCDLVWESSDEAVASVQNGEVTANGYGYCVITATAPNGVSAFMPVYVCEAPESVNFDRTSYGLSTDGEPIRLNPVFSPDDSMSGGLEYSTDDSSVAAVDENGVVTPLSCGTCLVTLTTAEGLSCSAEIRVYDNVKSLYASVNSAELTRYSFKDITFYSEAGHEYTGDISAFSQDESVCVFANGQLYGKAPGKTQITFSVPGTSVTCRVSVTVTEAGATPSRALALTFDNGPDEYTLDILKVLDRYGVKATFFVLGKNITGCAQAASALGNSAHEIGNHTYDNSSISSDSFAETAQALEKTDRLCEEYMGRLPTLLRAPDALLPSSVLTSFLDTRRYVGRGYDMNDSNGASADEIVSAALGRVYNTSVLTFHDCGRNTAAALEILLPRLLKDGYRFMTVSELIDYTGSTEGVFSTKP